MHSDRAVLTANNGCTRSRRRRTRTNGVLGKRFAFFRRRKHARRPFGCFRSRRTELQYRRVIRVEGLRGRLQTRDARRGVAYGRRNRSPANDVRRTRVRETRRKPSRVAIRRELQNDSDGQRGPVKISPSLPPPHTHTRARTDPAPRRASVNQVTPCVAAVREGAS